MLRSARRLLARKGRETAGEFLTEGPQAVREACAAGVVRRAFATAAAAHRHPELIRSLRRVGAEVLEASDNDIASLADTVTPQGIVAICRIVASGIDDLVASRPRLVVVCAQVRDPGNAGTVIRCADAFGAEGVVLTQGSVEPYNPKVVRASVGSLFHVPVISDAPLTEAVTALKRAGLRVLATDGTGAASLTDLDRTRELDGKVAWLLGNEAWGLPADVLALADRVVRIPMWGAAESLNLATAAAVCLYATAAAQHRT